MMETKTDHKYQVSVSPHVRDSITTQKIMMCVIIALIPSAIAGVINFGAHVLVVMLVSVLAAVLTEFLFEKAVKRKITISDMSAAVTGLLIALIMPPEIPWWVPVIGAVFAILIVKQLYGGLGKNFMNPALAARCFLLISFSSLMTDYSVTGGFTQLAQGTDDALSGATPLAFLKAGEHFDLCALFMGNVKGCIGETSVLAILIGAAFLLIMKVIDLSIPVSYLGSFALLTLVTAAAKGYQAPVEYMLEELCAGGVMFGAWFMATEYVTAPVTNKGRYIYGLLIGFMTWLFRMVGNSSEGVSYAIIFCNCLTPMIEHYTRPQAFGVVKQPKHKEKKTADADSDTKTKEAAKA